MLGHSLDAIPSECSSLSRHTNQGRLIVVIYNMRIYMSSSADTALLYRSNVCSTVETVCRLVLS
jgi:hypothetical protein